MEARQPTQGRSVPSLTRRRKHHTSPNLGGDSLHPQGRNRQLSLTSVLALVRSLDLASVCKRCTARGSYYTRCSATLPRSRSCKDAALCPLRNSALRGRRCQGGLWYHCTMRTHCKAFVRSSCTGATYTTCAVTSATEPYCPLQGALRKHGCACSLPSHPRNGRILPSPQSTWCTPFGQGLSATMCIVGSASPAPPWSRCSQA
jgi:hypothetical protein